MSTKHTPECREGSSLNWLVVNPDGKLLAILDSESEAYWFTRNRGHAAGAVFFKAACDYSGAPEMLAALKAVHDDPYTTCACAEKVRAAISKAEGKGE